jgi:hypothetical protein
MPIVSTRAIPWARSAARHAQLPRSFATTARGATVEEVRCPPVIKATLESTFSQGRNVKPHALNSTIKCFRDASKSDPSIRDFVERVKELHDRYDTPYCVRKGPVLEGHDDTFLNVVFAEMLASIVDVEISGEVVLKGRDAAVEAMHVDRGLQCLSRLKDVVMLSCMSNPFNIPFEVLPFRDIKPKLSPETIDKLRSTNCYINSEALMYSIPVLSKDEVGRDRLFIDQTLRFQCQPHVKELLDVIDSLMPNVISVALEPGDVVVMHNFSGTHRRGSTSPDGRPFTTEEYRAREMIRFDALYNSQAGFTI